MPLQVFKGNQAAYQVYWNGVGLNGLRRYDVVMGGFAVSHNVNERTAIGTSGAGPCQIIVVHKALGHGALGHYAADPDPNMIVAGVQRMIQRLGGLPVAHVLFAAGGIGGWGEQFNYELGIVSRLRPLCPGARITWPAVPQDDVWGSCYYLPLEEQVGLLVDSPGGFVGTGDAAHGITVFNY